MRNTERLRALHLGTEVPPPHRLAGALVRAVGLTNEMREAADAQRRLDQQIAEESSVQLED